MIAKRFSKLASRLLGIVSLAAYCVSFAPGAKAQQVIGGLQIFPSNSIWNTRVDGLPVDKNSSKYIGSLGAAAHFHPDFGTDPTYGIPYNLVTGIPSANVPGYTFTYSDESDPGPYPPVTTALLIESSDWSNANGSDRHVLQVDTTNGVLYELYNTFINGSAVSADSGAIFNLTSNMLRPNTWTSADAAGLPVFPLLVNYPEAAGGPIKHAFRFTGRHADGYIWPGRHLIHPLTSGAPPFGQRFRLKKSFNISGFSPINQRILTAMQQYGLIFADIGSPWYVTGAPHSNWDDNDLNNLKSLKGSDFEAVDESSLMVNPDSAAVSGPSVPKAPGRPAPAPPHWPKLK